MAEQQASVSGRPPLARRCGWSTSAAETLGADDEK
jgi:hypothetical protein